MQQSSDAASFEIPASSGPPSASGKATVRENSAQSSHARLLCIIDRCVHTGVATQAGEARREPSLSLSDRYVDFYQLIFFSEFF